MKKFNDIRKIAHWHMNIIKELSRRWRLKL